MNSRRVDLDVWFIIRVCLIVAEVKNAAYCVFLLWDFLCAMHVEMHRFRFQLSTNDSYPVQIMHNVNFCD